MVREQGELMHNRCTNPCALLYRYDVAQFVMWWVPCFVGGGSGPH